MSGIDVAMPTRAMPQTINADSKWERLLGGGGVLAWVRFGTDAGVSGHPKPATSDDESVRAIDRTDAELSTCA